MPDDINSNGKRFEDELYVLSYSDIMNEVKMQTDNCSTSMSPGDI